jgi:hypothetical protein
MIDSMATVARSSAKGSGRSLIVEPAKEGIEIVLNGKHPPPKSRSR